MRLGLLPSQKRELQRVFKKAEAFDGFRQKTRRAFLGLCATAVGCSGASFLVGWRLGSNRDSASQPATPPTPLRSGDFDAIALGPLDRLRARALEVLAEIEMGRGTPALWIGVERLAHQAAVRDDGDAIRLRLLAMQAAVDVPPHLQPTFVWLTRPSPR